MSGSTKIPMIAGIAGTGASLAALAAIPGARSLLTQTIGLSAPGGTWRFIAILLALLNFKNLPFVWHYRIFRGLIYHVYLQPRPLPPHAIFQPIIISTRTPFTECDYNLHKSNATYFTDLDEARTHLVSSLLRTGIKRLGQKNTAQKNDEDIANYIKSQSPPAGDVTPPPPNGNFNIALGAVSCFFKREISPYEKVEIWTRLLCWDRKWLYIVSHFVRAGAVKPKNFTLQPWKIGQEKSDELTEEEKTRLKNAVVATSIAKYVVKKGRLTLPPEQVLRRSDLLPPRPEEANGSANGAPKEVSNGDVKDEDAVVPPEIEGEWTWEKVEEQREKGMKFVEAFEHLDGLHDTFDGGVDGAIGRY